MAVISVNGHDGFWEDAAVGFSIAANATEVLPRVDRDALCAMLRRLPEEDAELALSHKLVPVVSVGGLVLYVACSPSALAEGQAAGLRIVATAEVQDLLAAVRAIFGRRLLDDATNTLARRQPEFSARHRLSAEQGLALAALAAAATAAAVVLPGGLAWTLASSVSGGFFLTVVALRILCLMPPPQHPRRAAAARDLPEERLPPYSVLVPLFRETRVLHQLLRALRQLRYPEGKLDIKLILEEEDIAMQRALSGLALDRRFEVIVVPAGLPQTKPRALNYALPFCRGAYLTIYDAEDVPERDQLLKAARRFAAAPPDLACLQARLSFYNPEDNWLARQFTAEYAALFGAMLPALAAHRLPIPLGGTSNHFRIDVLRRVGGWDPYNVTEDADLGLRLARRGYDTGVLDSVTWEEANTRPANWLRQRARWLKGFLATWLVHMRAPGRLLRELGPTGFWTAQAMTIGVFASVLLHPICMAATLPALLGLHPAPAGEVMFMPALASLNAFVLLGGYGASIALAWRGLARDGHGASWGVLATMPAYWLLMSLAAWLALWQFLRAPFHWNKTEHGIARRRLRAVPRRGIA